MNKISLLLIGKGFSVTRASGELQVLIPRRIADLTSGIESRIARSTDWAKVLSPFYEMPHSVALKHRCLLVSQSEISVVCANSTIDEHSRPSVLAVAATQNIDWNREIIDSVAQCHAVALRFARQFASLFRSDRELAASQLRAGVLLTDRHFAADEQDLLELDFWRGVTDEVRRWDGITGIADAKLIELGANIVIGSDTDVQNLSATGLHVSGRYDPATKELTPERNGGLRLFPVAAPVDSGLEGVAAFERTVQGFGETMLARMDRGFRDLGDLLEAGLKDIAKAIKKSVK